MDPSRPNTVRLQKLARAYRETGALLAAVELDLFSKISEGANTEHLLIDALGISKLNAERIIIACLGLGLIIRKQQFIENAPDVERFLVRTKSTYAGEWMFFTHPDWDKWGQLVEFLREKSPPELDNKTVKRLIKDGASPLEVTRKALDDYLTKGQTHHDIQKTKTVNIITGEGTQRIGLESKDVNDMKASASYLFGIGRNDALNNRTENEVIAEIKKQYGDQLTKITGSKPLETEIVDQIMSLATNKKPKKYRSNTTHRKSIKGATKTKLSKAINLFFKSKFDGFFSTAKL